MQDWRSAAGSPEADDHLITGRLLLVYTPRSMMITLYSGFIGVNYPMEWNRLFLELRTLQDLSFS